MTPDRERRLEAQAEAFYWAARYPGRMPNPTASATAREELHKHYVMTGKKKVLGQRSYAAAFACSQIPHDRWVQQVRNAIEAGYPVTEDVRAEAGLFSPNTTVSQPGPARSPTTDRSGHP